jgi:hypothetical protein
MRWYIQLPPGVKSLMYCGEKPHTDKTNTRKLLVTGITSAILTLRLGPDVEHFKRLIFFEQRLQIP